MRYDEKSSRAVWGTLAMANVAPLVPRSLRQHLSLELQGTLVALNTVLGEGQAQTLPRLSNAIVDRLQHSVSDAVAAIAARWGTTAWFRNSCCAELDIVDHSINVCLLAIVLGSALGWRPPELEELGLAALLHDVGKIMVPEEILSKPGPLSTDETALVRAHTEHGRRLLAQTEALPETAALVAWQHHERWEGQGYPGRLRRYAIHPFARIVAVADVYDALTSHRPQRAPYSSAAALALFRGEARACFEPELVDVLLDCVAASPVGSLICLGRRPEQEDR